MARTKQASKRNRRSKAVPVLGAAGLSLSLASGASASTSGAAADVSPQNTSPNHQIFLGEEEISDVSLSTFYVFDKENAASTRKMPHNLESAKKLPGGADAAAADAADAGAAGEVAGAAAAVAAAPGAAACPGAAVAGVRPHPELTSTDANHRAGSCLTQPTCLICGAIDNSRSRFANIASRW